MFSSLSTKLIIFMFGISICLALENESPQILSFAFEEFDAIHNEWKSTTDIENGKHIRLVCTVDGPLGMDFNILKEGDTTPLGNLTYPNNRQVIHDLGILGCSDLGSYVCKNGSASNKTLELGIFGCKPRSCDERENTTIIKSAALYQPVNITLCVIAYPEIGVDFPSTLSKNQIENKNGFQTAKGSGTANGANAWKSDVGTNSAVFGEHIISISNPNIKVDDYGSYNMTIFIMHKGAPQVLTYTIVLEPSEKGPPECPTNLEITDYKVDSIALSWEPGFNGGSSQWFLVYTLLKDGEWGLTGNTITENSLHLQDLQADTEYSFRVIPVNKFQKMPNANMCQDTVEGRTERLTNIGEADTNSVVIIGVCAVVIPAVILLVVLGLYCFKRSVFCPIDDPERNGGEHDVVKGLLASFKGKLSWTGHTHEHNANNST